MEETPTLDVRRLQAVVAGRATINDGSTHDVLKAKGHTVQSIKTAAAGKGGEAMDQALRDCVPTLAEEQLQDLNADQKAAIFGLATAGIAAVEALFPNVKGPDAVPTSPG